MNRSARTVLGFALLLAASGCAKEMTHTARTDLLEELGEEAVRVEFESLWPQLTRYGEWTVSVTRDGYVDSIGNHRRWLDFRDFRVWENGDMKFNMAIDKKSVRGYVVPHGGWPENRDLRLMWLWVAMDMPTLEKARRYIDLVWSLRQPHYEARLAAAAEGQ